MKKSCLFAVSALLLLLGGCYGDKGNYDYREINEIVIGARGFEGVEYKLRSGIDELKISPYIIRVAGPRATGATNTNGWSSVRSAIRASAPRSPGRAIWTMP